MSYDDYGNVQKHGFSKILQYDLSIFMTIYHHNCTIIKVT